MNLDRVFELLSAEADDNLTTAERNELDSLISSSEDARQLANEVRRMDNFLDNQRAIAPPPGLRDDIMQQIPFGNSPSTAPNDNGLSAWLRNLTWRPFLMHAASTAFGALLVIAVYESQPDFGPNTDITQLVGTMAPGTVIADKVVLDRFSFDEAGISSIARLEKRGKAVVLDVRIDADRAVDLVIDFGGTNLQFEAVAQTNTEFDAMQFSNRVLQVKGRGERRFSVLLRSPDGVAYTGDEAIQLKYSSEGSLLQSAALKSRRK